uniref:Drebrin n=1 Tax=Pelusios castaneus TaxID=367368 RepID=A0A8C8SM00_9SAUR
MAGVSFGEHRLALLAAYQEVIGEGSPTDWALYTYEDDSDDLKLAASGGGGLQELSRHFENQKVMYGFCSVKEPQATLPKYVLVNWVGEDVADARKCACASHVAKVAEFFQGVDVIVNASSVEDVDPGAIGQRLSNGLARIASPVLHRLRLREEENAEPVGTTYQKTDAAVEMKRLNREQFWEQAKVGAEINLACLCKAQVQPLVPAGMGVCGHVPRVSWGWGEAPNQEAAAIIAQRPDNPREFFKQQERVASGGSDAASPFSHRTGEGSTWGRAWLGRERGALGPGDDCSAGAFKPWVGTQDGVADPGSRCPGCQTGMCCSEMPWWVADIPSFSQLSPEKKSWKTTELGGKAWR